MMKLAFITDEATQSLAEAIAFAKRHELDGVELRSVDGLPIDQIPQSTLLSYRKALDDAGLRVCNLAGSFYKSKPQAREAELEKLGRLCDAADILGCDTIRGFAFFAPTSGPEITKETLAAFPPAIELLTKRGKLLLLEADPSVNTTNHAALAELLRRLDSPALGAIYDPGNDIYDPLHEVPYPDGYEAVRPWLRHVHIKDAALDADGNPQCVCIGTGVVDYPRLLRALLRDGYQGWLSLETHYRKNAVISEALMRQPGGAAFSEGGLAATAESIDALRTLLAQAKEDFT